MFNYTQAAIHKICNDVKKTAFFFNLFAPIIYIAYLIVNLITKPDFFYINLALLIISTAYFGFFIYTSCKNVRKYIKKTVSRVYKYSKIILKTLTLGILIYGIIIENGTPSLLSIIMLVASGIALLLSILIEIIARIVEWWATITIEGFKMDVNWIIKTFSFLHSFYDPTPPPPPTPIQVKAQEFLKEYEPKATDQIALSKKEKKAAKRQQAKQARKARWERIVGKMKSKQQKETQADEEIAADEG